MAGLLCGNATLAEDAVAEVFARLYRRWQPGTIGDVDAYLRRAVVNEIEPDAGQAFEGCRGSGG